MSRNQIKISDEEAEKLEVGCGFCDKRIRIRSLAEHVNVEHEQRLTD